MIYFLSQSDLIPPKRFNIICQFDYYFRKFISVLLILFLNPFDLYILLFFLLVEFFFIDNLQAITFSFCKFILFLNPLKMIFKVLQKSLNRLFMLCGQISNLIIKSLLHSILISNKNLQLLLLILQFFLIKFLKFLFELSVCDFNFFDVLSVFIFLFGFRLLKQLIIFT